MIVGREKMTVYNFNLLLGFEPNGVDVAQAHRLQLFRNLDIDTRFVFTQWPSTDQLDYFLSKGYDYDELLFAQLLFTDQQRALPTLSSDELEKKLGLTASQIIHETTTGRTYQLNEGELLVFVNDKKDFSKVKYIEYFSDGYLLKRETYASTKLVTDYFILNYQNDYVLAQLGRRAYHNLDGSVGLEEILVNGKQRYLLQNEKLITHAELMESFVKKLQLNENDLVIMDRASGMDFTRPLLEQQSGARLGLVFHSEHTFGNQPFSYEYYYPVKYSYRFDFMIVSTDIQAKVLKESFEKEGKAAPRIYVIPVGSMKQLHYSEQDRKATKVMTASRLIYSKRVDLAIRAVALANEKGGDIEFSIFGHGIEYDSLENLIQELGAQEYIHLMGYADLTAQYLKHSIYLTTSLSETFGLTLMEATGAGLAMVGFDLRYGNPSFIKDGFNGYLISFEDKNDQERVEEIAQSLLALSSGDLSRYREASYQLAGSYLEEKILDIWRDFFSNESSISFQK